MSDPVQDETPGTPQWAKGRRSDRIRAKDLVTQAKAAQAAAMAVEYAAGKSIAAIADKYAVTQVTVKKRLSTMEKAGFFSFFEESVLEKLVPKALAVYEAALDRGELAAARDVLHGINVLRKDGKQPVDVAKNAVETLEEYRALRAKTGADAPKESVN